MAERFVHVNSDQSVMVSGHQPIATVIYRGMAANSPRGAWITHSEQRIAHYSPGSLRQTVPMGLLMSARC
jgi:hypothetical protein